MSSQRIVFLDYVRVVACFMVVVVHCCEMFYLFDGQIVYPNPDNRWWVSAIDGLFRAAVPLFVMATAYLLAPLQYDSVTFFKRRFVRVFIPFLIWSIFYAVMPVMLGQIEGSAVERIERLFYSFNDDSGHLWYIYMLIGVYAILPIISPWLAQVSKRGEQIFLAIWLITTLAPYLREFFGEIWGECGWNIYHSFYYYSGFIGYVVLGHYIREHVNIDCNKAILYGSVMILVGWAITSGIFYYRTGISTDYSFGERSFNFCTINNVLTTAGFFIIFRTIKTRSDKTIKLVTDISKLSYGMYLIHIFVLGFVAAIVLPIVNDLGGMLITAVITYMLSYIICKLISFIPGGKYIVG